MSDSRTAPDPHPSSLHPADLHPGVLVRHPQEPDWGLGQVQSAIGNRVTVNFEHRGKVTINTAVITLLAADDAS